MIISQMNSKISTLLWFLTRPPFYEHALELVKRQIRPSLDRIADVSEATEWAAKRAVSVEHALYEIGLNSTNGLPVINPSVLSEAGSRVSTTSVNLGGQADLQLLYAAVVLSKASKVIETGVAYGWSSLSILSGLQHTQDGELVSVDMPYPKMNTEDFVGIAVPLELRARWTLISLPDRPGIKMAISKHGGFIDLCHYDSDKTWWGRHYAYPLLWSALRPGGIFISDDIPDNMYFAQFTEITRAPFAITECLGKFVGIMVKH